MEKSHSDEKIIQIKMDMINHLKYELMFDGNDWSDDEIRELRQNIAELEQEISVIRKKIN